MLHIALTGGIAAGKSTAAAAFARHGAVVIDSDLLAREAVAPGSPGLRAVLETFGSDVVCADGSLDRAQLARIVFADEVARQRLEAIVHPFVRARSVELVAALPEEATVVHDLPLLVETGMADEFDLVVVVDVPVQVQVDRLMAQRGMSDSDAHARVAAQAGRKERLAAADEVLDGGGDVEALVADVDELWERLAR